MRAPRFLVLVVLVCGCATLEGAQPSALRRVLGCDGLVDAFECDRRAILAMQGTYEVSFNFDETVVLSPGYVKRPPKRSSAREAVILVADRGRSIELQHVLVVAGGRVVKHWRQVWEYEATSSWTFVGDQRFEPRAIAVEDARGTWTQQTYEVNDAPRYAAKGRWSHARGESTWTSEPTLRPLPRREYSTRADYDLVEAINRHTITPFGWTHEQDNVKLVRRCGGPARGLVREFGFNEYRLGTDGLRQASDYWSEARPFWELVRARWDEALAKGAVRLTYPVNEERRLVAFLEQAQAFRGTRDLAEASRWLETSVPALVASADSPAPPDIGCSQVAVTPP
jgi:hypothetical protein